ncbi:hypothetical protein ACFVJS_03245 [Nocardioides sp. NPDC057772]|uniref:hypothetical protein n=1 Tax=Nocardioides sp. NPDC057772 TaxID=3346245 RepID=UPI003671254A
MKYLSLCLLLVATCGVTSCGTDEIEPFSRKSACGLPAHLFEDVAGTSRFTVTERGDARLPLEPTAGGALRCEVYTEGENLAVDVTLRFRSKDVWESTIREISESKHQQASTAGPIGVDVDATGDGRFDGWWTCGSWSTSGVPVAYVTGSASGADVDSVNELVGSIARAQGCPGG